MSRQNELEIAYRGALHALETSLRGPLTLRQARERRRWTQEELAVAADVYQSVISRIENGVIVNPGFDIVVKLAKALDIDPRSLKFGVHEERVAS